MDDRSLKALLARGERELSGARPGPARFWAAAALVFTAVGGYLGTLLVRSGPIGGGPRALAAVLGAIFALLALYCFIRLLRS